MRVGVVAVDSIPETTFLIVRHPETEANVTGRLVGRGDTPYTLRGEAQRVLLSEWIAAFGPDRIVASPLLRAWRVATLAAERIGLEASADPRLTELDFGVAEGLGHAEIERLGIEFDFRSVRAPVAPGGESRADIMERAIAAAAAQAASGGRVALVTHGGVVRSLIVHLLGLPIDDIWSFDIQPACVAEIHVADGFGRMRLFLPAIDWSDS